MAIATETRAEYGLLRPIYRALDRQAGVEPTFLASGMHHLARFGHTIDAIRGDGFRVRAIRTIGPGPAGAEDGPARKADSIARAVAGYAAALVDFDWLVVLGDRLEMLAAVTAATALGKPIAHVHGGDVAPGAHDDAIRHAITKLAHLHFPATADAARRIRRLGEPAWRIRLAGAPAIDAIRQTVLPDKAELDRLAGFDTGQPFALVVQHACGHSPRQEQAFLRDTLAAASARFDRAVVIGAGLDAGSSLLHDTAREFIENRLCNRTHRRPTDSRPGASSSRVAPPSRPARSAQDETSPAWVFFPTLEQGYYLALMSRAAVLVGNSSSGIIESGHFRLAVVDVGPRQRRRLCSCNVIRCDYGRANVSRAIERAVCDRGFRRRLGRCRNLYGRGVAGATIARALAGAAIGRRLLVKEISY